MLRFQDFQLFLGLRLGSGPATLPLRLALVHDVHHRVLRLLALTEPWPSGVRRKRLSYSYSPEVHIFLASLAMLFLAVMLQLLTLSRLSLVSSPKQVQDSSRVLEGLRHLSTSSKRAFPAFMQLSISAVSLADISSVQPDSMSSMHLSRVASSSVKLTPSCLQLGFDLLLPRAVMRVSRVLLKFPFYKYRYSTGMKMST